MTDIPEWALKRMCEIVNQDGSTYEPEQFKDSDGWTTSIGEAFAAYIAQHEQPPKDGRVEAICHNIRRFDCSFLEESHRLLHVFDDLGLLVTREAWEKRNG